MIGELFTFFVVALSAVFFIVDPIALVPIFVSMTANDPPKKSAAMAARACWVGASLLGFFAIFGGIIFQVLGISLPAFRVAGGILLLITALDMLRARTSETRTSDAETQEGIGKDDIAIVPLAMPLLAGPGAIATVMVLMSQAKSWWWGGAVLVAIALTFAVSYVVLRGAPFFQRVLGTSGIAILQRVMGLLLAAIAVQFIGEGAKELWSARSA
jgi:multiple antibiotic resistance protein